MRNRNVLFALSWFAFAAGSALASPLFAQHAGIECENAEGTVEEMICSYPDLLSLDSLMSDVWLRVLESSADNPDIKQIKAEQRGWIKGRNDCWKADDIRSCIAESYRLRIAEMQARWRLVDQRGPFFFSCEGNPANEVVATFFETDPPAAVLERGDQTVVAFIQPSGSGARYEGMNVIFWNKGDEATVVWGWGADTLRCVLRDPQE